MAGADMGGADMGGADMGGGGTGKSSTTIGAAPPDGGRGHSAHAETTAAWQSKDTAKAQRMIQPNRSSQWAQASHPA